MSERRSTARADAGLSVLQDRGPQEDPLSRFQRLEQALAQYVKGKPQAIRLSLVALLARGHVLIEDVPGVGKTTLALALASHLGCSFARIQFTSDLLPTDILGVSLYNQIESRFEFRPGPVFNNIILADELNRTTPKTQSCLLEAMNDGKVSIEGVTRPLEQPFLVIATQNPLEHHGTFPLPESQLDRFLLRFPIGYPDKEAEREIIRGIRRPEPGKAAPLLAPEAVVEAQEQVTRVHVAEALEDYLLAIVEATRTTRRLELGVSPRGARHLYQAAQASAFLDGRTHVVPDDIKHLAVPVLSHRVVPAGMAGLPVPANEVEALMADLVASVAVPD